MGIAIQCGPRHAYLVQQICHPRGTLRIDNDCGLVANFVTDLPPDAQGTRTVRFMSA